MNNETTPYTVTPNASVEETPPQPLRPIIVFAAMHFGGAVSLLQIVHLNLASYQLIPLLFVGIICYGLLLGKRWSWFLVVSYLEASACGIFLLPLLAIPIWAALFIVPIYAGFLIYFLKSSTMTHFNANPELRRIYVMTLPFLGYTVMFFLGVLLWVIILLTGMSAAKPL